MTLIWEDPRIKGEFADHFDFRRLASITKGDNSLIWVPETEIENLKGLKFLNDPVKFLWVQIFPSTPDMIIFPINRTLITVYIEWHVFLSCEFDFSKYPLDEQICEFGMMFYDSNITLVDKPYSIRHRLTKNVSESHGFKVRKIVLPIIQDNYPGTIFEYGKLTYDIKMKRMVRPYFYQYYLPCASIVTASGLSFIVPISATPGRIALVVTQFLTLTNLFINQKVVRKQFIIFQLLS